MLTYDMTNTGGAPLYEHLYQCIRRDILAGKLQAEEKLPSKRMLAKNLGISVITVENAYAQLLAEGYLYSLPKKGFYVSDLQEYMPAVKAAVQKPGAKILLPQEDTVRYETDFASSQTDTQVFPFSIWTRTMREVMAQRQEELMIKSPCGGIRRLRESIARYLMDFRGMQVQPEQVIIGAGTEYLYGLLIQLLGRDLVYGVENPGYHRAAQIYESMQVPCAYIDMDRDGIIVSELEKKQVQVMHISPSHHFPTGIVMPVSRRYELLGWAAKQEGRYILEDDYDSELRLSGKPIPTMQSIDVQGKVIYMNTFTKTLCSTVRISYMVLPEALTELFYQKMSFYACTVSNFEQYTLARFIENGSFEKHINRLRSYYQTKRDKLLDALTHHEIHSCISIREEEAGVHFLMHIDRDKPEEQIVAAAAAQGIRLDPVSGYYFGEPRGQTNWYVMNYASVDGARAGEIADKLYLAISRA